jgi:hypothetical protein
MITIEDIKKFFKTTSELVRVEELQTYSTINTNYQLLEVATGLYGDFDETFEVAIFGTER